MDKKSSEIPKKTEYLNFEEKLDNVISELRLNMNNLNDLESRLLGTEVSKSLSPEEPNCIVGKIKLIDFYTKEISILVFNINNQMNGCFIK